jgi:hypothetical protein
MAPSRGCDSILRGDLELELELHREADREADERDLELCAGERVGKGCAERWQGKLDAGKGEGKRAGV